MMVW
jgi:hypothetical protein